MFSGPGHLLGGTIEDWESKGTTEDSRLVRIELVAFEGNEPLAFQFDTSADRKVEFEARLAAPGAKWWWLEPGQAGANVVKVIPRAELN